MGIAFNLEVKCDSKEAAKGILDSIGLHIEDDDEWNRHGDDYVEATRLIKLEVHYITCENEYFGNSNYVGLLITHKGGYTESLEESRQHIVVLLAIKEQLLEKGYEINDYSTDITI